MYMPNLLDLALVGILAIILGVWLARRHNRDDGAKLSRGICPDCGARKSLLHSRINSLTFVTFCDNCGGQWVTQASDHLDMPRIVTKVGKRVAAHSLVMESPHDAPWEVRFKTVLGWVQYDPTSLHIGQMKALSAPDMTPRKILQRLYEDGVVPSRTKYEHMDDVPEHSRYTYFIESAGIEPMLPQDN